MLFEMLSTILMNSQLIAITFLGAALIKAYKREWENIVPRAIITLWYLYLALYPDRFTSDQIRVVGRWLFTLLACVETIFHLARWLVKKYLKKLETIEKKAADNVV